MGFPVTTNGRLMIGGKATVIYSTVMLDRRGSCLTLLLVKCKTIISNEQMTFWALTNVMRLLVILQFLSILVGVGAGSAFRAVLLYWITVAGTKPRTERLTAFLLGEDQFREH